MNKTAMFPEAPVVFPKHSVEVSSDAYLFQEAGEKLSVEVAESLSAVEALRPIWSKWSHNLDTDLDYYVHNLKSDSTILRPHVVTVCQQGIPQAMLVGKVRKCRVSSVVSFVNIRGPEATVLTVDRGGRMGQESNAIDRLLAMQLLRAAKSAGVDLILFRRLALQSTLFRELQQSRGLLIQQRVPHIFCYSVLPLTAPAGKRSPVFSGKNLRETRKKTRILQRSVPDGAKFKCFCKPSELDLGIHDAATVSVASWQHYLGLDYLSDGRAHENLDFCAGRGWLRVYVMYIDDSPCAYLIGQLYKRTFYCQYAGYDQAFARFSVGSLLTAWAMENLAAAGVEEVDLGEGGQEHNRRLGCRVQEEGAVHVYFPTLRGLRANIFFAAAQMVRAAGRKAITELRLNWASKAWSEFLIARWRDRNRVGSYVHEQ
jgi:hypothetical protein